MHDFLKVVRVKEVVDSNVPLISASLNTSLRDALEILTKNGILALAVLSDSNSSSSNDGNNNDNNNEDNSKYACVVSVLDIMAFIAFKSGENIMLEPLRTICGISEEGQTLWEYQSEDFLVDIMETFSKGVHRCLVCQSNNNNNNNKDNDYLMMTQTDVVRFFHKHKSELKTIFDTPITETGPGIQRVVRGRVIKQRKLITAKESTTTIAAYQKIYNQEVNAIAIVSEIDGSLLATLSASDIKGTLEHLSDIEIPILEYLKKIQGGSIRPQIVVENKSEVTINHVVDLIITHKLHRVWVVQPDTMIPVDVITLTDIISWFSSIY